MVDIYTTDMPTARPVRRFCGTSSTMLGQQLRDLRTRANLRQVDLAARLGVAQATISHVERGGVTTTDVLEAWVAACNGVIVASTRDDATIGAALAAFAALSPDDQARVLRIASVIGRAPNAAKDGLIIALESLARE